MIKNFNPCLSIFNFEFSLLSKYPIGTSRILIFLFKHLDEKCGEKSEIEAYFPEDFENINNIVELADEYRIIWDVNTKLIFGVWSKKARAIDTEIVVAARYPKSARKLNVFIDEEHWKQGHFNIDRGELKHLDETFSSVYSVDFKKDYKKCYNNVIIT